MHRSRSQHAIHLCSHFPFRAPRDRTAGEDEAFQGRLEGLKIYSLREWFHRQHVQTGSTGASTEFGRSIRLQTVDGQTVERYFSAASTDCCLKKRMLPFKRFLVSEVMPNQTENMKL